MPRAKSPQTRKTKALTIDFSGICTFIWNKKEGTAEVRLVDLASAGFQRHYAGFALEVTEATPHAVKGPNADVAVSVSGEDKDVGVWDLFGTTVEIVGATGKLSVDDTKVDVTKKPGKKADSIRWLADIRFLCQSDKLDPVSPTAAAIQLPAGHVTAAAGYAARKLEFLDDGVPVGPERYCTPRFRAVVPFVDELAIRLSRERVLRFSDSMSVVVSNTCVCGLGVGPTANHFYGHYDVVKAKRRPVAKRAGPQPLTPSYPEICFGGFVEL